jgi:comEA protein
MITRVLTLHLLSWVLALSSPGCSIHAQSKKKPLLRPVNINTANFEELQRVPGIGPKTAQRILDTRKSVGRFKSVDDLLAVPGIGEKRLAKMRQYLTVGPEPKKKEAPAETPPSKPPAGGEKPPG